MFLVYAAKLAAQATRVAVISHGGEHLHHPENTMAAFEAAYQVGADFIEVDIRTTSDRKLVLMHDSTTERTTGVKGEIAKMTFEQVHALDAGAQLDALLGMVGSPYLGTRPASLRRKEST